ncbi:unnamed protein product, partial [Ectocarpus sp. 4 AP-2014]
MQTTVVCQHQMWVSQVVLTVGGHSNYVEAGYTGGFEFFEVVCGLPNDKDALRCYLRFVRNWMFHRLGDLGELPRVCPCCCVGAASCVVDWCSYNVPSFRCSPVLDTQALDYL